MSNLFLRVAQLSLIACSSAAQLPPVIPKRCAWPGRGVGLPLLDCSSRVCVCVCVLKHFPFKTTLLNWGTRLCTSGFLRPCACQCRRVSFWPCVCICEVHMYICFTFCSLCAQAYAPCPECIKVGVCCLQEVLRRSVFSL